jgi:plastocyanin
MMSAVTKCDRARGPRQGAAALSLLLASFALVGCGSSSNGSSTATSAAGAPTGGVSGSASAGSGGGHTLDLAANQEGVLGFNTSSASAAAGKLKIDFTNNSPLAHNVTIASASGAVLGATPTFVDGSRTLSLHLKPGTYKFYCSVPGHRQAGMEGTLTVR